MIVAARKQIKETSTEFHGKRRTEGKLELEGKGKNCKKYRVKKGIEGDKINSK